MALTYEDFKIFNFKQLSLKTVIINYNSDVQ